MNALRVLLITCFLLFPASAQAAPALQTAACDFSRWPLIGWLSGMTVTSPHIVNVKGVELRLSICAPASDDATAEGMLNLLESALPNLSRHAGVPLRGAKVRPILMVDKAQLGSNIDGQLTEQGIIELHSRSREWTVVHEGAHYWANEWNFAEPWMFEGYANYLTEQTMGDLNMDRSIDPTEPICANVALRTWVNNGLNLCAYTTGAAVFRDLVRAVGEDVFTQTLAGLADRRPIDSESLLAALEKNSHKDLLFAMQPVFGNAEFQARQRGRQLMGQLRDINVQGAPLNIAPPALITTAIAQRDFTTAEAWLAPLSTLVPAAAAVAAACNTVVLSCDPIWQRLPQNPAELSTIEARLREAAPMLDQYRALKQRADALPIGMPATLVQAASALDPAATAAIAQANTSLDGGQALDKRCATIGATCPDAWRSHWSAGAFVDADNAAAGVNAVLTKGENIDKRCGDFVKICRGYWDEPLSRYQIPEAHQALSTLETRLNHAEAVKQRCGDLAATCWNAWRTRIEQDRFEGGEKELLAIEDMLARGGSLEARCSSWPCQDAWRDTYRQQGSTAAAIARMDEIAGALPDLQAAAAIKTATAGASQHELAPDTQLAEVQRALAAGQVAQARALAVAIVDANNNQAAVAARVPFVILAIMLMLLIAGLILFLRTARRPRRQPQPPRGPAGDADLLAALLAQPPARQRRKT